MRLILLTALYILTNTSSFGQFSSKKFILKEPYALDQLDGFDADSDGDIDLLSNDLSCIYENLGEGEFSQRYNLIPCSMSHSDLRAVAFQCTDLNNDGMKDIVAIKRAGTEHLVYWHKNLGEWEFSERIPISDEIDEGTDVVSADINMDGLLDIVTTSYNDNKVAWYENLGDDSFGPQQVISTVIMSPNDIHVDDIDADGDPDLIVTSYVGESLVWFENTGGIFSLPIVLSSEVYNFSSVETGDMNGDGDADIIVSTDDYYMWYPNLGGSFGDPFIPSPDDSPWAGATANDISCADIDNDSDLDLIFSRSTYPMGGIYVLLNPGDGSSFLFSSYDASGEIGHEIASYANFINDFDADGDLDIMATRARAAHTDMSGITFYKRSSEPELNFELSDLSKHTRHTHDLEFADLNNDDQLDAIYCGNTWTSEGGVILWHQFDNNGQFGQQIVLPNSDWDLNSVSAGDIDLDSDLDLIVTSRSSGTVGWYENIGDGLFNDLVFILDLPEALKAIPVDMDNDGDLDLLCERWNSPGPGIASTINWCENLGDGTFAATPDLTGTVNGTKRKVLKDLNGDGRIDIVAIRGYNSVAWYENEGDGLFAAPATIYSDVDDLASISANDVNEDGDIDIATNTSDASIIIENLGDGEFGSIAVSAEGHLMSNFADLDNDSYPDFIGFKSNQIVSNYNIDGLLFSENEIIGTPISFLDSYLINTVIDIDGDGDEDIVYSSTESFYECEIAWFENYSNPDPVIDVSAPEEVKMEFINLYPNPSTGIITIELPTSESNVTIEVYNLTGKLEFSQTLSNEIEKIDLSSLASGAYLVQINGDFGIKKSKLIRH